MLRDFASVSTVTYFKKTKQKQQKKKPLPYIAPTFPRMIFNKAQQMRQGWLPVFHHQHLLCESISNNQSYYYYLVSFKMENLQLRTWTWSV